MQNSGLNTTITKSKNKQKVATQEFKQLNITRLLGIDYI